MHNLSGTGDFDLGRVVDLAAVLGVRDEIRARLGPPPNGKQQKEVTCSPA